MDVMVVNAFMVGQKKRGAASRLPQVVYNGFYLAFHEMLPTRIVVHFLQVSAKGLTMLNPSIEVLYGGVYTAVGCIEHGEFAFEISTGCEHCDL